MDGTKGKFISRADGALDSVLVQGFGLFSQGQLIEELLIKGPWVGTNPVPVTISMKYNASISGAFAGVDYTNQLLLATLSTTQASGQNIARIDTNVEGGVIHPTSDYSQGNFSVVISPPSETSFGATLSVTAMVDSQHPYIPIIIENISWGVGSGTSPL